METDNRILGLWLMMTAGQGTQLLFECLKKYQSLKTIYGLSGKKIATDLKIKLKNPESALKLDDKNLDKAKEILDECEKRGISVVSYNDENYPKPLKGIKDPPCVLFTVGQPLNIGMNPKIGIVGTRRATDEGKHLASEIAYDLSRSGYTVISGLAKGIDESAHKGALLAGQPTVSVIAGSVDYIYPKENSELYNKIKENGTVISEYPPDTSPMNFMFHARNRIISALSNGVLVVESDIKGGSMITAAHAKEQGRPLFAVPGFPGRKESIGPNDLLKHGAFTVTCAKDIIDDMNPYFANTLILTERGVKLNDIKEKGYFNPIVDLKPNDNSESEASDEAVKESVAVKYKGIPIKIPKQKPKKEYFLTDNPVVVHTPEEKEAAMKAVKIEAHEAEVNALTGDERIIYDTVDKLDGSCTVDDLVNATNLPVQTVIFKLTNLEFDNLIEEVGGGKYKIRKIN